MLLLALPLLSAFVFNSVAASPDTVKQSGFDCGRVFFKSNVIRNAGSLASQIMKRSSQISLVDEVSFRGRKLNNAEWLPIRESGQIQRSSRLLTTVLARESFYLVVDSSSRVKDVMARLSNDDFTRCLRKNSRRKSSLLDTSNGYRCGQNFFGDEQLKGDVNEAISKLGQGLKYPSPYKGNLYTGHEYLTWPILNGKKDNTSHWEQSPFHVILSRDGKVIDVIAKLKCNDFIKCERATKSLRGRSTKTSLLQRRNQVPGIANSCSTIDYDDGFLNLSLEMALLARFDKKIPGSYPMEYKKNPCEMVSCRIWPLLKGKFYSNGGTDKPKKDFLMISKENKLRGILTMDEKGMMVLCRNWPPLKLNPGSPGNGNTQISGPPGKPPVGPLVRTQVGPLVRTPVGPLAGLPPVDGFTTTTTRAPRNKPITN